MSRHTSSTHQVFYNDTKHPDEHHLLPSHTSSNASPTIISRIVARDSRAALVVALCFLATVFVSSLGSLQDLITPQQPWACSKHPVSCKIDYANTLFSEFQARQSKTPAEAHLQYRKRYNRDPPPGFDKWVRFALKHNATVIDDFDQLEKDLSVFRKHRITGYALRQRIADAKLINPGEALGTLSIIDGKPLSFGPGAGPMSSITLQELLEPVASDLPDLTILFNWYAESRSLQDDLANPQQPLKVYDYSHIETVSIMQDSCPANHLSSSPARQVLDPPLDYCRSNQDQLQPLHGFFQAPDQFRPFSQPIPLLSRSKLSPFSDVLIPNVCYFHPDYRGYDESDPIPFEQKHDSVYWRGANTGLFQTVNTWANGHRHRVMRYAKQLREASEKLNGRGERDPMDSVQKGEQMHKGPMVPSRDSVQVAGNTLPLFDYQDKSLTAAVKRLGAKAFDVAFSNLFSIDNDQAMIDSTAAHLPVMGFEGRQASFKHKFVLDLDGQSMSCRLYRLLDSNSIVIKQTIWSEWHDDRLFPWLHYIPMGLEIEDNQLPLVLDFFLNDPEGKIQAARIAKASTEWSQATLRPIDITIYYYRVLLEYASLFHDT